MHCTVILYNDFKNCMPINRPCHALSPSPSFHLSSGSAPSSSPGVGLSGTTGAKQTRHPTLSKEIPPPFSALPPSIHGSLPLSLPHSLPPSLIFFPLHYCLPPDTSLPLPLSTSHQVLHHLLSQVLVDTIQLVLSEQCAQLRAQLLGRFQVLSKGLLHNDTRPSTCRREWGETNAI